MNSPHTLKGLRKEFKAIGKFHTPPELVATITSLAKSQIIGEPRDVYDPTCGAGDLLAAWPEETPKYGQDIDEEALKDAEQNLSKFTGFLGDTLAAPAFMNKRFHVIVANPPFSIKWKPVADERFWEAPTIPTQSKADYAFILHILHLLDDDGAAVVMGFPGILYRGGREGKIRAWLVDQNLISHVVRIPGGKFEDTTIETCILILKKCRTTTDIQFIDMEHDLTEVIDHKRVQAEDYNLSVHAYVQPAEPEQEPVNEVALQERARSQMLQHLHSDLECDALICQIAGFNDHGEYLDQIARLIDEHRTV